MRYALDTNMNLTPISYCSPANFKQLCNAIQNHMPNLHDCTFVGLPHDCAIMGYAPIEAVDQLWIMPMDLIRALPVSLSHLTLHFSSIFGRSLHEMVSLCRRFEKLKSVNLVYTRQFEMLRELEQSRVEIQCEELRERGILYFGDAPSCEKFGCNS